MDPSIDQPPGRFALINGRVILPNEIVSGQAMIIEGNKILDVAPVASVGARAETIDVQGRYIAPGLIDIHTHGAVGHSFHEPTEEAFGAITRAQATQGITSILATIATAPIDDMVRCTEFGREWMRDQHEGAQVLGVHLEGPYFSMEQRGAQDPNSLRTPDDGSADLLLEQHDVMKVMSFAPELPGAMELTARLDALGVVPAAGHSSARDEHLWAAMRLGLRHVIHVWSGQSSTVREGPWRKPGLLEATLASDGLTVEMICDNRHLPATLMKLGYRCLGADRLCVISDATNGAGLPNGTHFRMGGMEYDVYDGVAMMLDRTAFAGSTTFINQMVPILTGVVGIPLAEAVRMGSLTPARVIGVAGHKGSLEAGKDADLAIFEEDFTAWRTMIGGRWAYVKPS